MGKCKDCVVGLFGACGRNADYCRLERETLMDQARSLAGRWGHTLGEFIQVQGYSVWQARCLECGQAAFIDIDPATDGRVVYGDATAGRCPAASENPDVDSDVQPNVPVTNDVPPWERPLNPV